MARMKKDLSKQCKCKKKPGSDYCGRHIKCNNISRIDGTSDSTDKPKSLYDLIIKHNITTCSDLIKLNTLTKCDLQSILQSYKQSVLGKKQNILHAIFKDVSLLLPYLSDISKIVTLQKMCRGWYTRYINRLRGPALLRRSICVNQDDFMTFDPIKDIPMELFISIAHDSKIYGFDIRSLHSLSMHSNQLIYENPYTRSPFTTSIIHKIDKLKSNLQVRGISIYHEEEQHNSPDIEMKRKTVKIFQKLDELDNYTDVDWFLNLNITYLKLYYKFLEDIWNYRAELTKEAKNKIVPNSNNLFKLSVKQVYGIHDKLKVQNICLNNILRLIDSGINHSCKTTGSIYVLTAFTMVSTSAAQAYPHLVQHDT
jgi:hypothetical protein